MSSSRGLPLVIPYPPVPYYYDYRNVVGYSEKTSWAPNDEARA